MWGRSIMWGRQSYRWGDFDFEANLREGISIDWPVRYKEIAPGMIMWKPLQELAARPKG